MTSTDLDEVELTYIAGIAMTLLDLNQLEVLYDAFCTWQDRRERAKILANERFRRRHS